MTIQIVSDFVCPFCFYLDALLRKIPERPEIEHLPFELTPPPKPREDPWNDPVRRERYARDLGPACREIGLEMKLPPRVSPRPYTRLAQEGWHFAREQGLGEAYHRRVMEAYFQEERDIGKLAVLTDLARDTGLDSGAFQSALLSHRYTVVQQEAVRHAREDLRVTVIPCLLANGLRLEGFLRLNELRTWLRQAEEAGQGFKD